MAKWADWLVTAVHFTNGRITKVQIREDLGDTVSVNAKTVTSGWVMDQINSGVTFATATYAEKTTGGGSWTFGARVDARLTTYADNKLTDNLDKLPTF